MRIIGFEIENKKGLWSALLGLFASIVMAMGSDGLLGGVANLTSDWGDVNAAVSTLHSYNVNEVGGRAILTQKDTGFNELREVLSTKVPWLKYNKPDYFLMNTPATIGGAPRKVVHAIFKQKGETISDFYIIDGWISQEKQKDYLYKGLFILFMSFCMA